MQTLTYSKLYNDALKAGALMYASWSEAFAAGALVAYGKFDFCSCILAIL